MLYAFCFTSGVAAGVWLAVFVVWLAERRAINKAMDDRIRYTLTPKGDETVARLVREAEELTGRGEELI